MNRPAGLPDFRAPPLNEMAIGVQFMPCSGYNSLMAAQVWDLFKKTNPIAQEYPPTAPNFETFGPVQQQINLEFLQAPISNRFFFITEKGDDVIQFQSDKLFHNWRRIDNNMNTHVYPRFEDVFSKFKFEISKLESFFREKQGVGLNINQAEITYVNHLDISADRDLSKWLSYIAPKIGVADDFNGNFRRILRDKDGKPESRFICESSTATDVHGRSLIAMSLTVRGAPKGTGVREALEFLQKSREIVVAAFADLTTDSAQKAWERTQ